MSKLSFFLKGLQYDIDDMRVKARILFNAAQKSIKKRFSKSKPMNGIDWQKIKKSPPENISLLVRMDFGGPVYDVAIFTGITKDGERKWIMGDINLNHKSITHWAMIEEP